MGQAPTAKLGTDGAGDQEGNRVKDVLRPGTGAETAAQTGTQGA